MRTIARKGSGSGAAALAAAAGLLAACNPLSRPSLDSYAPLWAQPASIPAGELSVRFLGTSSFVLTDGDRTIMIDGFFTRPSTFPMLLLPIKTDLRRVKDGLRRAQVSEIPPGATKPTVDAIFVAHSHHDHVMDSAAVAKLTGATLIGSLSTFNVVGGSGYSGTFKFAGHGKRFEYGNFVVTLWETPHSLGDLFGGKIRRPLRRPAWLGDFRAGTNYSFLIEHRKGGQDPARRILIVPSAHRDLALPKLSADIVFLSTARLSNHHNAWVQEYWRKTVSDTCAKLVIPIHWDDVRRPFEDPLKTIPLIQDNFHRGMRMIMPLALRQGVELRLPRPFDPIDLEPRAPAPDRAAPACGDGGTAGEAP